MKKEKQKKKERSVILCLWFKAVSLFVSVFVFKPKLGVA